MGFEDYLREIPALPRGEKRPGLYQPTLKSTVLIGFANSAQKSFRFVPKSLLSQGWGEGGLVGVKKQD